MRDFLRKIWARLNGTQAPQSLAKNAIPKTVDPLRCPCGGTPVVPKDEVSCPNCYTTIEGDVARWNRMVERLDTLAECCKVDENLEALDQTSGPLVRCTQCNRRFYNFGE